jgi:hypothetical protein
MAVSPVSSTSLNLTYKRKITKKKKKSKVQILLDMTQITVMHIHQRFKVTCCFHFGRFVFTQTVAFTLTIVNGSNLTRN